jgi:DNA-binding transcriptional MerR regulator
VAAELVGSAPQNLRLYEARGLLNPARSAGGTRRYSGVDLARLREIGRLLDDGLNLPASLPCWSCKPQTGCSRSSLTKSVVEPTDQELRGVVTGHEGEEAEDMDLNVVGSNR